MRRARLLLSTTVGRRCHHQQCTPDALQFNSQQSRRRHDAATPVQITSQRIRRIPSAHTTVVRSLSSNRSTSLSYTFWGYDSSLSPLSWETAMSMALRHDECESRLEQADSALLADTTRLISLNKEVRQLQRVTDLVRAIVAHRSEVGKCDAIIAECQRAIAANHNSEDAKEMMALAQSERAAQVDMVVAVESSLIDHLLPSARDAHRNAILEVRAGTGGEEAAIFARDIFHMYEAYAARKDWTFTVVERSLAEKGGYKEAIAIVAGDGAYGTLQYETGVHRVQRVPVTETNGRVHTSAMTVAVLPEAEEVDVELADRDLRIDTYRSGGKGGQHVNTTDSAVRITHIPTGVTVTMQDERSQLQNKAKAMRILRSRLYERARQEEAAKRSAMRNEQIGHGERNERIRTYNFASSRVSDHRVNLSVFGMERMLEGHLLDTIIEQVRHQDKLKQIQALNGE